MENSESRFDRDVQRILKGMRKAIPRDADGRALLFVCAEIIRIAIEGMPLEDQPHVWAAIIADMQEHAA